MGREYRVFLGNTCVPNTLYYIEKDQYNNFGIIPPRELQFLQTHTSCHASQIMRSYFLKGNFALSVRQKLSEDGKETTIY